nr:Tetratricopeptide repeat-like superfamily protein, putative [Ipomoea batatas]GMD47533.1 Tetratricopeptide repeat-like superfamily protein, putative [Ipomoea batatas]
MPHWMRNALLLWMPVEGCNGRRGSNGNSYGGLVEMEVKCDFVKAEEYFGMLILANTNEGNIFALYADLILYLARMLLEPSHIMIKL